jgi:hypothetical protein
MPDEEPWARFQYIYATKIEVWDPLYPTSHRICHLEHVVSASARESAFVPVAILSVSALTQLLQLTGISGYTGAHVASQLLKEGYRVRG